MAFHSSQDLTSGPRTLDARPAGLRDEEERAATRAPRGSHVSLRPVVRRILLVCATLFLITLAWGTISGGLRQIPRSLSWPASRDRCAARVRAAEPADGDHMLLVAPVGSARSCRLGRFACGDGRLLFTCLGPPGSLRRAGLCRRRAVDGAGDHPAASNWARGLTGTIPALSSSGRCQPEEVSCRSSVSMSFTRLTGLTRRFKRSSSSRPAAGTTAESHRERAHAKTRFALAVQGRVLDSHGDVLPGAPLEIWQTKASHWPSSS